MTTSSINPPPPGGYRAILADPPWLKYQRGRFGAGNHYDLMTNTDILGLGDAVREIAAEQSFCFLWVTTGTVELGFEVLRAWGFEYKSYFFWAKPRFTLGAYFRNAGELVLLGVRGTGTKVAYRSMPNWGFYPLLSHSEKPAEFHHVVERMAGPGRYLELFARRPAPSNGSWDVWGNQVPATVSLEPWGYPVPADDPSPDVPSGQDPPQ